MNYQQSPEVRQCGPFFSRQYFYENPEIQEEPAPYMDNVTFSESDGYIDVPLVHSVPSHDIQELYIRRPLPSTSQLLATSQHRCCLNGHSPFPVDYLRDLKPCPPSHLKEAYPAQIIPRRPLSSYSTKTTPSENLIPNTRYETEPERKYFRSYSAIPFKNGRPNGGNLTQAPVKSFPLQCRYGRLSRRPMTPLRLREFPTSSEPFTHHSESTEENQLPSISKSQEINVHNESHPELALGTSVGVKKMNSEGDATKTIDENEVDQMSDTHKEEIKRISKFLIPRVPSSLKEIRKKREKISGNEVDKSVKLEVENTSKAVSFKDSLNSILDQLENCEISLNAVRSKYSMDSKTHQKNQEPNKETAENEIFNLKDISEKMLNSEKNDNGKVEIEPQATIEFTSTGISEEILNSSNSLSKTETQSSSDELSALELHRSKSYIVDLIDRALSRELGTIAEDKTDKFKDLTPRKVIRQLTKNCRIKNNLPISTKESKINGHQKITSLMECRDSQTSFSNDNEAPYIKQLKDLRWGHFRHIQQEMRRLEDLERFLDNCGAFSSTAY